jgi:hypothetical protein
MDPSDLGSALGVGPVKMSSIASVSWHWFKALEDIASVRRHHFRALEDIASAVSRHHSLEEGPTVEHPTVGHKYRPVVRLIDLV